MKPTEEQTNLIDEIHKGSHVLGKARAGTGKSTTAVQAAALNKKRKMVYVVFNTKNAKELNDRPDKPSNLEASTFSSKCLRTLGRNLHVKVKSFNGGKWSKGKNEEIIQRNPLFNPYNSSFDKAQKMEAKENFDAADDCLSKLKNTYLTPSFIDVINLMNRYQISPCMDRSEFANHMIAFLNQSDEDQYNIDFDDMIRFCVLRGLGKDILQDVFLVDECQDNTPIRTMLMSQISENGQVVGIGDDKQAIYGFAGADSDSIATIIKSVEGIKEMPLTVNFRCDKNIIRKAQAYVPDIKYLESKEDGIVEYTKMEDLHKNFQPGDVGLSRYNRIIIPKCFSFIKEGKAATIQGADFGKMLKSQVAGFRATSIEDFYTRLDGWYEKQCKYSEDTPSESVSERYGCLKFLADNSDTVEKIATTIDGIFSDKTREDTYMFSTGHKSKGLEWNRVHILDANNFINKKEGITAEQAQQEQNLMYIAVTRAKNYLNFAS